jgi:hypothetical protein
METLGRPTRRWLRKASQGAGALGIALGLVTLGWAHGGDPSLVHSCVQKSSGQTRLVQPDDVCRGTEVAVDWPASAAPVGPAATPPAFLNVVDSNGHVVGPVISLNGLDAVVGVKVGGSVIVLQLIGQQLVGYDFAWFAGAGCTGQAYVQQSQATLPNTAVDAAGRVYVETRPASPALVVIGSYVFGGACQPGGFSMFVVPASLVGDLNSIFTPPFHLE